MLRRALDFVSLSAGAGERGGRLIRLRARTSRAALRRRRHERCFSGTMMSYIGGVWARASFRTMLLSSVGVKPTSYICLPFALCSLKNIALARRASYIFRHAHLGIFIVENDYLYLPCWYNTRAIAQAR